MASSRYRTHPDPTKLVCEVHHRESYRDCDCSASAKKQVLFLQDEHPDQHGKDNARLAQGRDEGHGMCTHCVNNDAVSRAGDEPAQPQPTPIL